MVRLIFMVLVSAVIPAALLQPARAIETVAKARSSSVKRELLLFAKDPQTWRIIHGGGSGKMSYRQSSGAFSLTASGLAARSAYALVRYADDPPKAQILARGTSDGQGRLNLKGIWHDWTRKFWLVSGEDVTGNAGETGSFLAWRPDRYLFEEKQLGIACSCPVQKEP